MNAVKWKVEAAEDTFAIERFRTRTPVCAGCAGPGQVLMCF